MFRVSAVLQQSVQTFVRNFIPFFAISALGLAALLTLIFFTFSELYSTLVSLTSDEERATFLAANQTEIYVRLGICIVLGGAILMAINVAIVFGAIIDLRGRSVGFGECIRSGISKIPQALGITILWALAVIGLMIGVTLITYAIGTMIGPTSPQEPAIYLLATIYLPLFLLGFLILFIRWYVVIPAMVVENVGVVKSFHRSSVLTSNNRWSLLILVILILIASILISRISNALQSVLQSSGAYLVGPIFGFALQASLLAFGAVLVAVVYHDLRVSRDGLGTDQITSSLD